ncbi:uncharacterized protein LOC119073129 [Bradysia coprophila]|uniref:uncharacterized protein LOC119073129 n=1 Tax=Bradysia coprophila TaxID=38358 RepID=UPI00187D9B9E|nr:uncharacterized protein LOC119073129 [Bradysia coprophila]
MAEANVIEPDNNLPNDEVDGILQQVARNNNNHGRIDAVQIKMPPFWKADPELWFLQIEAQFSSANIRTDLSKYNQIVGKLDSDILSKVSDIVKNPPATHKYDAIKARLTTEFADSDKKKLRTLFHDLSLNEDKPSESILSCSNEPLTQQVIMADKIFETLDQNSIQALSSKNDKSDTDIATQFCKLEEQIAALHKDFNRSRSRNSPARQYRSRSGSNSNQLSHNDKQCYYHRIYKSKARKCKPPCNFKTDSKN